MHRSYLIPENSNSHPVYCRFSIEYILYVRMVRACINCMLNTAWVMYIRTLCRLDFDYAEVYLKNDNSSTITPSSNPQPYYPRQVRMHCMYICMFCM